VEGRGSRAETCTSGQAQRGPVRYILQHVLAFGPTFAQLCGTGQRLNKITGIGLCCRRHRLAARFTPSQRPYKCCAGVGFEVDDMQLANHPCPSPSPPRSSLCRMRAGQQGCLKISSRDLPSGDSLPFAINASPFTGRPPVNRLRQRSDAQLLLRAKGGGPSLRMQNYLSPMSVARGKAPAQGPKAVNRQRCDAMAPAARILPTFTPTCNLEQSGWLALPCLPYKVPPSGWPTSPRVRRRSEKSCRQSTDSKP
jgi:hypothetical protein